MPSPTLYQVFKNAAEGDGPAIGSAVYAIVLENRPSFARTLAVEIVRSRIGNAINTQDWLATKLGISVNALNTTYAKQYIQWKRSWLANLAEEFRNKDCKAPYF